MTALVSFMAVPPYTVTLNELFLFFLLWDTLDMGLHSSEEELIDAAAIPFGPKRAS